VNTPFFNPVCSAGPPQTVKLGSTITLTATNSYPLDGGTSLTYSWSYFTGSDGVNQNATLSAPDSVTTTTSVLTQFGSADFQLTVADGSGNQATCIVRHGVVAADSNGVIDLTAEGVDATSQKILGPLIMFGANPWPWADDRHKRTLDIQIANHANFYSPWWRTPMPGTISINNGSVEVVGTDTDLRAPCGGGSTSLGTAVLFIRYPGTDSRTHYTAMGVASCTDASHLTLATAYPAAPNAPFPSCSPCSGLQWQWGYADGTTTYSPQYQFGNWIYFSAPWNYYDVAKSMYAFYLRSGIDTYLTEFQNIVDEWWEFPNLDQGYSCYSGIAGFEQNWNLCWAPANWRSMALTGVYLRALQEGPTSPKWAGLRVITQMDNFFLNTLVPNQNPHGSIDLREEGYALTYLSYCALADPDGTQRSACQLQVKNTLANVWTPFIRSDLNNVWGEFKYDNTVPANQTSSVTSIGGAGSVCVTNGSTSVVGSGTNWTSALEHGGANGFWTWTGTLGQAPASNSDGDPVFYSATIVDTTHLTLNTPYAGATACGKSYEFGYPGQNGSSFVGWGVQPFMMGHLAQAFGTAAKAMRDYDPDSEALFNTYMDNAVQWLITYGTNPDLGGFYSASMHVGCVPPISSSNLPCYPAGASASSARTLATEAMRAYAMDYQVTGSPTVKAAADALMDRFFSKPGTGGPNPDGFYLSDYENTGFFMFGTPPNGTAPKWAGVLCGYTEACDTWPAARIAPLASATGTQVKGSVAVRGKVAIK
jgi:hypothetical protein